MMLSEMKAQIEQLREQQKNKTYLEVAKKLGITDRHLRDIRDGIEKPGGSLRLLILELCQKAPKSEQTHGSVEVIKKT